MSDIDIRYENGKIYKIVCNINGDLYIGSTIRTLNIRLIAHNTDYKRYLKGKCRYTTSYDIIKGNDFYIELIENYPCNNKRELETQERFHIEHKICINKYLPTRTKKEWREDNKQHTKQYRIKNKDKIREQRKIKIECVCGSILRKDCLNYHERTKKHLNFINNNIN